MLLILHQKALNLSIYLTGSLVYIFTLACVFPALRVGGIKKNTKVTQLLALSALAGTPPMPMFFAKLWVFSPILYGASKAFLCTFAFLNLAAIAMYWFFFNAAISSTTTGPATTTDLTALMSLPLILINPTSITLH